MKEGWEYKKLIDVCDFQGGSQPPKSEWIKHDSPGYIRMLQIRDFTQSRKVSPEYVKLTNRTKCCFSDDILIGRYGASLGIILTGIAGAYNVAIMRTIPNETLLSKGYLKYYLMSSIFQSFLLNIGGRAAQAGFNKEDLKCLNIPITTLDEQRRIVSYLDSSFKSIDEIKDKALKSLTEAKALFQSALAEAMEPKEGWEEKTLGEICTIVGRIGFRGYTRKDIVSDKKDGAITLSPSNIVDGKMSYLNCTYISWYKYEESPEIKIYEGDILMVKTGSSYGKTAYVDYLPHKATINPQFVVLKDVKINKKYLSYQLKTKNTFDYIKSIVSGSAIPTFSQANLAKMELTVPPLSSQEQIVTHLDTLSSTIRKLEENYRKTLAECDALKQAVLREVFE